MNLCRLFLAALLFTPTFILTAMSQQQAYRPTALRYENASGEKGITTYHYNDEGVNDSAHWQLLDNSRSSENTHTIDEQGGWRANRGFFPTVSPLWKNTSTTTKAASKKKPWNSPAA